MNYIRLILLLWVGCAVGAMAQNVKVQGTVLSGDDNEPLIGVNVAIVGTTKGVFTDENGAYVIESDPESTIKFTYIGFKPIEEKVKNRTTINVRLQSETEMLDEIVFMGYSSQKKAELTSSIVTIGGDKLRDITTSDAGSMLQGKVAGVQITNSTGQPGSTASIRIRGTGSISAQSEPLYVVDGIPGGTFNPNDVETMTVLKDAAATALYGSSASSGVIVVTTKSAKSNQPTSVNLKATYGQTKALHGNFEMMNGAELYDMHRQVMNESQRPAGLRDKNFNWLDAAFDTGNVQNYYVSVANSSDKTSYMLSTDYYTQDGTLINTNYDKISSRLNLNTKLTDKIDMNLRVNYSQSKNRQASSYMTSEGGYSNMPWDNPYDEDGNILKIDSDYRPDNGEKWYTQDKRNFLHNEQYNYARTKSHSFDTDLQLNWNMLEWLMFTSSNRFSRSGYTYSRYVDNRTNDPSYSEGYYGENIGQGSGWTTSNLLKANKTFGIHGVSGFVGFETGRSTYRYTAASGLKLIPGLATITETQTAGQESYGYDDVSWSVFGQAQYNLLGRYFFTASMRADASSRFAKDRRVGYFPAVSGAWNVSDEPFFPKNDVLKTLKLRASYGVTGNSNIPRFQSLAAFALDGSYLSSAGLMSTRLENRRLAWEKAHMSGVGIDFNFFKRLDISVDVYNIDNKDLLLMVPKSPTSGILERLENAGQVRNQGVELQITSENIRSKDWGWTTSFNIGTNRNEVKNLPGNKGIDLQASNVRQRLTNGEDITSWFMPRWMGVDYETGDPIWEKVIRDANGNEIGREGTSVYGEAENQIVGKATPKFNGGFGTSVRYKSLTLDVTTNFVYGNKIYNRTREQYDSDGAYLGYNMMKLKSNWSRWEAPGDIATHPRFAANGNKQSNSTSSRYLENGSFFRIKNMTLAYDLPSQWLKPIGMKTCKVFVSGDNLLTFTKFSGMDPEVNLSRTEWSLPGLYTYSYPISRQFLIGFDLKF